MAPPYAIVNAGPLLPLAPENQAGKKAPPIRLSQLRVLLKVFLPRKRQCLETLIGQELWIQARNHRAYPFHRKKQMRKLVRKP